MKSLSLDSPESAETLAKEASTAKASGRAPVPAPGAFGGPSFYHSSSSVVHTPPYEQLPMEVMANYKYKGLSKFLLISMRPVKVPISSLYERLARQWALKVLPLLSSPS